VADAAPQPPAPPPIHPAAPPPVDPAAPPRPYAGSELPEYPYSDPAAYGPYPGHPPAPATAPGTNGFAIGALVVSICGGFGLGSALGLAFGITALVQIKRRPQKGRGLAVAAVVISGLTLVVTLVVGAVMVVDEMRNTAAGIETVETAELRPGDCISELNTSTAVYDLPVVSCSRPHDAEVYHVFTLPSGSYPGAAAVETQSEQTCGSVFDLYSTTPGTEDLEIYYLSPQDSAEWWRHRGVVCIAFDPNGTRTASFFR
jgi:hypothetical protein